MTGIIHSNWSSEKNELLRELWETQGLPASRCAMELGVSRNAVIGRARRMGLVHLAYASCDWPRKPPSRIRKPYLRRTASPHQFIRETGLPLVEKSQEVFRHPISFMQLERRHCRWPIDDIDTGERMYCGVTKEDGISYCMAHARIAFTHVRPRTENERARIVIQIRRQQKEKIMRGGV